MLIQKVLPTDVNEFCPFLRFNDQNPVLDQVTLPFSFGKRSCIGRNLSYLEMKVLLSTRSNVYRKFCSLAMVLNSSTSVAFI